jgi:hypothetical protein
VCTLRRCALGACPASRTMPPPRFASPRRSDEPLKRAPRDGCQPAGRNPRSVRLRFVAVVAGLDGSGNWRWRRRKRKGLGSRKGVANRRASPALTLSVRLGDRLFGRERSAERSGRRPWSASPGRRSEGVSSARFPRLARQQLGREGRARDCVTRRVGSPPRPPKGG